MMDINKQAYLRRLFINYRGASKFRNDQKGLLASQAVPTHNGFQFRAKTIQNADKRAVQRADMFTETLPGT